MNVFFSDLDNTLIYSHRRRIPGKKVPVEMLDGKEQSYMTDFTYSFFRNADWLPLVPVTTRSEAQYRRLLFPEAFRIRYALICNGGKLLADGEEDPEWSAETTELARDDLADLRELGAILGELCGREVRAPEEYYYYTKTDEPEKVCEALRKRNPKGNIRIEHDQRKVYLFPKAIHKGTAVRRFAERFGVRVSAGAGDSMMDVPMLNETDYPLAAEPVRGFVRNPAAGTLAGEIISDRICLELEALHQRGIL